MEIIKAEGPDDYDIVVDDDDNLCRKCKNRYHCRMARRSITDCEHYAK